MKKGGSLLVPNEDKKNMESFLLFPNSLRCLGSGDKASEKKKWRSFYGVGSNRDGGFQK